MRGTQTNLVRRAGTWACSLAVVSAAYATAWLLRFEFFVPEASRPLFLRGWLLALLTQGLCLCFLQPRLDYWARLSGFTDAIRLIRHNVFAWLLVCLCWQFWLGPAFPRSVAVLELMLCLLFGGALQFGSRFAYESTRLRRGSSSCRGLLIYGAGVAGLALAREVRGNPRLGYQALGFLDDDPAKHGTTLLNLPVLGGGSDAVLISERLKHAHPPLTEIIVSMPSASGDQIRAALSRGKATGVPCRVVPALGELLSGKFSGGAAHHVSVTDLLGRERVQLDQTHIREFIQGRVVLVTGAAGSIGSELCAQLAQFDPRCIVALDQAESEIFRLEAQLRDRCPGLNLQMEVADIRDLHHIEHILQQHAPDSVFHAAAYKHVPLMEERVCEAAQNNVIGTWNLVQAAHRMRVPNFLLISSDKAVNPTSVMGLTKRVAELIVSAERHHIGHVASTRFLCVRFGNVLVSNGSVVPTFEKQISRGGPVTVTHPEMRRYFMTVEEAVQLVLESATLGNGSEIYMLDMGTPIRIVELASKMITMAGLVPDRDIEIRFTGLRPGEKLFEDLSFDSEQQRATRHEKIRAYVCRRLDFAELVPWITELQHLIWRRQSEAVQAHLAALVPEYRPEVYTKLAADAKAPAPAPLQGLVVAQHAG